MNKQTRWITQTAILIALLVVLQAATMPLNNTLITGSLVNLILIISVAIGGIASGVTVAALSPVFAKLIGIGPLWSLIPFILLGNIVLTLCWHFMRNIRFVSPAILLPAKVLISSLAKFLTLYIGIVMVAIPFLLQLPEKQAATISAMFSYPQLFTAIIGGSLASVILPILQKAIKQSR